MKPRSMPRNLTDRIMGKWIYKIMCAVMLLAISAQPAFATDDVAAGDIDAAQQLAMLRDDIHTPQIPKGQRVAIREYMLSQARRLKDAGFKVETMRKGEVVIVTLPTDDLFPPNDSVLYENVEGRLKRFVTYLKTPGMYKVVLAAHSDDTGSETYQLNLTEARILALYDFFERYVTDASSLIGYPLGGIKPLAPNDTRSRRAANRRVEIYIVPDDGLIALAREKRL